MEINKYLRLFTKSSYRARVSELIQIKVDTVTV